MLLTNIFHRPMLLWEILPLVAVALFVVLLLWDTRLPAEKKIFKRSKGVSTGKGHHLHM